MHDLIGDIHGHADELEALLKKLGYTKEGDAYRHPTRTVVFLGDYIDRGPKIPETLAIVRAMVDAGNAMALMGNHEYNALCYHLPIGDGKFLREHSDKNIHQHEETLRQFGNSPERLAPWLAWFRMLPLSLETETFRAVHACWDQRHIELLKNEEGAQPITDDWLRRSAEDNPLYTAVDETLKGKEIELPEGQTFKDKYKVERNEIRIRWWEHPEAQSYRSYSVTQEEELSEDPVTEFKHADGFIYGSHERPVFFGHYWLQAHHPAILRANIACLDHSVAKDGSLMAYRFDGEQVLDPGKLVSVRAGDGPGHAYPPEPAPTAWPSG